MSERKTQRWRLRLSYDGQDFYGYQIQSGERTVQGVMEDALSQIHDQEPVSTVNASRTDRGVHAKGQCLHFDSWRELSADQWRLALNGNLPADVRVESAEAVPDDFHARYQALAKRYRYTLLNRPWHNPMRRAYEALEPRALNVSLIEEALPLFEGHHDFSAFRCTKKGEPPDRSPWRRIFKTSLSYQDQRLEFTFTGNGFLYKQVRTMVGTLWEVGLERLSVDELIGLLQGGTRKEAGMTAPAQGLCLERIWYPGDEGAEGFCSDET